MNFPFADESHLHSFLNDGAGMKMLFWGVMKPTFSHFNEAFVRNHLGSSDLQKNQSRFQLTFALMLNIKQTWWSFAADLVDALSTEVFLDYWHGKCTSNCKTASDATFGSNLRDISHSLFLLVEFVGGCRCHTKPNFGAWSILWVAGSRLPTF